ncbi:MAG: polysaccharide deacetylase family protein [Sciscionella sp.]
MTNSGPTTRTPRRDVDSRAVPILMYHALGTRAAPGFSRFTLHPRLFAKHMALLAHRGCRTLTVTQVMELRAQGAACPPGSVVLTFDDGYADFHDQALPVLNKYGFTATLYVTTGHVGGIATWTCADENGDRPMLSWSQLAEVTAAGIEIGAHSHTHPELDMLSPLEIREEVTRSRGELTDRLGVPVTSFAYPFGYFSRVVTEAVADAGFASACTVKELAWDPGSEFLTVPRLSVTGGTEVATLQRLLETVPTARSRQVAEAKRLLWQAWRRRPRRQSSPAGIDLAAGGVCS